MACDLRFERELASQGYGCIAGVDEAGRGPLAGPVYAAAVILPQNFAHDVLTDSKKLSEKNRDRLYSEILSSSDIVWASASASVEEIDRLNILRASHLTMRRAVEALPVEPDIVLIDGLRVADFPWAQHPVVKGDSLSLSIAAASIIAKVERDRYMKEAALTYPGYGFEAHKGYGTAKHLECLRRLGPCPLHRRSFGPVSQLAFDFES